MHIETLVKVLRANQKNAKVTGPNCQLVPGFQFCMNDFSSGPVSNLYPDIWSLNS